MFISIGVAQIPTNDDAHTLTLVATNRSGSDLLSIALHRTCGPSMQKHNLHEGLQEAVGQR